MNSVLFKLNQCSGRAIKIITERNNKLENYSFIDLFAGIGAFRLALESFGAKCVFSSEWDKHSKHTYKANYGDEPAGDITKIDENNIPKHDILCAGFPCQAFSISGNQLGFKDTRGTLFYDIARIAKHHAPQVIFLENVKNFMRHDNGKTLKVVIRTLEKLGYAVFYKLLNAAYFGVPQNRERIYILAFHKRLNINEFQFPKELYTPVKVKDIILPDSETTDFIIKREDIRLNDNLEGVNISLVEGGPMKPVRIGTINKGGQGERIYHEDGLAITLSAYGGGVGAKTGVYMINGNIRKLAPRECARLMGFPDGFIIHPSRNAAYKQFGDSVVVDVLQHILFELVKAIEMGGKNGFSRKRVANC